METGRLTAFLLTLKQANLTRQQLKTMRGQALAGDIEGAEKGLKKLTRKSSTKPAKTPFSGCRNVEGDYKNCP